MHSNSVSLLVSQFISLNVAERQLEARRLASGKPPQKRQYYKIMTWLLDNDREEWLALTATTEAYICM